MPHDVSLFQAVTLAIAVLGAVLGFINTWMKMSENRIKASVRGRMIIPVGDGVVGVERLCIEVVNLGPVPFTVNMVGAKIRTTAKNKFIAIKNPMATGPAAKLPRRLEQREAVAAFANPGALTAERLQNIRYFCARTDCGVTIKGSVKALRNSMSKKAAEPEPQEMVG